MYSAKLELLKEEVEKVFGRKILSSSDCNNLSIDILQLTGLKISLNTLRRMFNLMKSEYRPSVFTLDLLAKYCGYSSYSIFDACKETETTNGINHDTVFLNFLVLIFEKFEVKGAYDVTYMHLIYEIINNLDQWPDVIDQFHRQIARTPNGQKFYFEQFINIDKLDRYYGKGLHYYLLEKRTAQAQLFGHSLLCFHSWLVMDQEMLKRHYAEMMRYPLDTTMEPLLSGRCFAAQLYMAEAENRDMETVITAARMFYNNLKPAPFLYQNFPCFEYALAEALVLTREYNDALFFIDEALRKKANYIQSNSYTDLNLFESLHLFKAIALANLGESDKAKSIVEKISIRNFNSLSKQYNSILYLSLKQQFQKRELLQKQVEHLVRETGFRKLIAYDIVLNSKVHH